VHCIALLYCHAAIFYVYTISKHDVGKLQHGKQCHEVSWRNFGDLRSARDRSSWLYLSQRYRVSVDDVITYSLNDLLDLVSERVNE